MSEQTQTSQASQTPPPADPNKNKPKPHIKCAQPGCKLVSENEDTATSEGWYLSPFGLWYCFQHNPTINRH